jgi:hypothetical protein
MLLVIDLAVWQAYKINYILMFRLDRRTYLGNMVFAEVPATWFAFLSLCFWLSWRPEISPYVLPTSLPLVFLLGTALWLLLPAPVLRPSARWWLVRSFVSCDKRAHCQAEPSDRLAHSSQALSPFNFVTSGLA